MPVSLTSKKQGVVKISSILPITFFPCTFSSLAPFLFLSPAFSLQLSAIGYLIRWDTRRKIQLSRHFNGFFGENVGKSLILKGFFQRDNVQKGALFFFRFSSF